MNSYPFLDNKHKPIFTEDLADIVPRIRKERIIDITNSPVVPATSLRIKLELLHRAGELDGGLPIVRHGILVGLIPAPDLGYALDQLEDEATNLCLMDHVPSIDEDEGEHDPTDFTPYIDPVSIPRYVLPRTPLTSNRHPSRWISDHQWTWFMSFSRSSDSGTSVC